MKFSLKNHVGAVLALLGASAIFVAIAGDPLRGQPLILGWMQFLLVFFGGAALLVSLPPVRRGLRAVLARSREQTPATQDKLRRQPRYYLLYSIWFGLIVGLVETAYWTYRKSILNERVLPFDIPGAHYVWLLPVGYVVLFAAVGLLLFGLAQRWPERISFRVPVFVFALMGFAGWLLLIRELHQLAALVLAAGLAVQSVRLLTGHTYLLDLIVRRTTLWLALSVIVLGGIMVGWQRWSEEQAIAQLSTPRSEAPNVLLLVLDTVRAKSLSLYGYERPTTPHLEQLAREGLVFENAFSTSPWTLPSHASMFTGRFPHEISARWRTPLDDEHPTLAEIFTEQGYTTAGFVSNTAYCTAEFGLDRGFIHYEDNPLSIRRAIEGTALGETLVNTFKLKTDPYLRKSAARVNQDFLQWLSGKEEDRPFFAFLNYFDAHDPYLPPRDFARKFSVKNAVNDVRSKPLDDWSPEEIEELNNAYDASIAYLDEQLGVLFEELKRRGVLENTLVIITSDHGEQFGEHGLLLHAASLYAPLLHVPLLVLFPSHVPADRRVDAFVSLRDLPATMVELAGLPDTARFPGKSLSTYWSAAPDSVVPPFEPLLAEVGRTDRRAFPETYPASKGALKALTFDGMHYIKGYGDDREELYDLVQDSNEQHDLSTTDPERLKPFRRHLEQMFEKTEPPTP